MLISQSESSLPHLLLYCHLKINSNVNALILNSAIEFVYLPEDSMDRYLKEFKMFFFSNSLFIWLFVFVYLVCCVISHYTYIPGVCSFVVIFYFLSFQLAFSYLRYVFLGIMEQKMMIASTIIAMMNQKVLVSLLAISFILLPHVRSFFFFIPIFQCFFYSGE